MNQNNHRIFGDYVLTGVLNAFNGKTSYWLTKKDCTRAVYCFSATTEKEVEAQLIGLESYIKMFDSVVSAPANNREGWADYADEHVLFLRPLNPFNPTDFECVKVTAGDAGTVMFLHDVIYLDDYLMGYDQDLEDLDAILKGFGYEGLDDFVSQSSPSYTNLIYKENGQLDRVNSPDYIIDFWHLASLICESRDGVPMSPEKAARLVEKLIGEDLHVFIQSLADTDGYVASADPVEADLPAPTSPTVDVPKTIWKILSGEIASEQTAAALERLPQTFFELAENEVKTDKTRALEMLRAYLNNEVNDLCIALSGWSFEDLVKRAGLIPDFDQTFQQREATK